MDALAELWSICVQGPNLPYTILLGFVLIYWLTVILGFLDLSTLDLDVDIDMDVDGADSAVFPSGLEGVL